MAQFELPAALPLKVHADNELPGSSCAAASAAASAAVCKWRSVTCSRATSITSPAMPRNTTMNIATITADWPLSVRPLGRDEQPVPSQCFTRLAGSPTPRACTA